MQYIDIVNKTFNSFHSLGNRIFENDTASNLNSNIPIKKNLKTKHKKFVFFFLNKLCINIRKKCNH